MVELKMYFFIYRNCSSEETFFNHCNFKTNKTHLKTKPVCQAQSKITSLLDETNHRRSFMSADKVTMESILKNSDEMRKWSCEKVGHYLDEINLGQYKQVSGKYIFLNILFCLDTFKRNVRCFILTYWFIKKFFLLKIIKKM